MAAFMHLHSYRPIKRAGEAGKALRAKAVIILFFPCLRGRILRQDDVRFSGAWSEGSAACRGAEAFWWEV
ncbi:hypothetical protein C2U55_00950 [Enterobacteriaceae bacterium ENNIH3]|nr:hypothetical protein C2U55_00950 [Enterobacteriaceae bacterium ENNIH3]AUV06960.1 hypothetical protein C2U52_12005 [Enterobacteriaceae bacterium ENNIH2]